ncbi:hypothetical protein Tco_1043124 [Tanacetum coccineum]|uniref:Uncharacterized protein n=1 Tax=Tanacetum coccineum TaxID=301880 RepID=A0ABQ5GMG9_9ASTR
MKSTKRTPAATICVLFEALLQLGSEPTGGNPGFYESTLPPGPTIGSKPTSKAKSLKDPDLGCQLCKKEMQQFSISEPFDVPRFEYLVVPYGNGESLFRDLSGGSPKLKKQLLVLSFLLECLVSAGSTLEVILLADANFCCSTPVSTGSYPSYADA